MMRFGMFLLVMLAAAPVFAADAERGAVIAKVRCMACHHLTTLSRSIGPSLKGVYGRAPTISGVPFDVWDDAALEAWLSGPRKIKPNTRMRIPPIAAADRADLIAYFERDAVRSKSKPLTAKDAK